MYYRIAQLADLFGITTATLRFYDKQGILCPGYRDPSSAYRYYTEIDAARLSYLLALRECGCSLEQMRTFIAGETPVSQQLEDLRMRRELLQECIHALMPLTNPMDYQPELVAIPACTCITRPVRGEHRGHVLETLGVLEQELVAQRQRTQGILRYMALYEGGMPSKRHFYPIACLRVQDAPNQVKIPSCRGLSVTHAGSWQDLSAAYQALRDHMEIKHLTTAGPVREYYLPSPVKGYGSAEGNLITRIVIPVKRDIQRKVPFYGTSSGK